MGLGGGTSTCPTGLMLQPWGVIAQEKKDGTWMRNLGPHRPRRPHRALRASPSSMEFWFSKNIRKALGNLPNRRCGRSIAMTFHAIRLRMLQYPEPDTQQPVQKH